MSAVNISSANRYDLAIQELIQRQNDLSSAQTQLTSGLRVNKPSDDPAAAAIAERALADNARATALQSAVNASNSNMTLAENALGTATSLTQQVRTLMVQAGDATLTDSDRQSLAAQITQLRNQLLTVANSTDGNGNYLFAGQGASQAPFVDASGGVQYTGVGNANTVASGLNLPMTMNGQSIFMQAPSGNGVFATSALVSNGSAWIDPGSVTDAAQLTGATYQINFSVAGGNTTFSVLKNGVATAQTGVAFTPPQAIQIDGMSATISGAPANGDSFQLAPSTPTVGVFSAIDQTIKDLNTTGRTASQIAQANSTNMSSLDAAMTQIEAARGLAGAVMNRITGITGQISAQTLADQTTVSNATDLNMTQAISSFQNQQTGYSAALKAYSMIQGLSMFNYLSSSGG